jgi:uncharacterized lipoprotein NlpE involved in copper resistance
MKRAGILASSVLVLALGGCASSPVVGTWTGRGGAPDAPFTFGSVSFVGDKTFTAEARYSGNTRVQSGTWATEGDELMLTSGATKREYTYKVNDGTLVVTDPKSGHSVTLDRMSK